MKLRSVFFTLFVISFSAHGYVFSGNTKLYPIINDAIYSQENLKSIQGSLKLQFQETIKNDINFESAYEITSLYQKYTLNSFASPSPSSYRLIDLDSSIHKGQDPSRYQLNLLQNLNRFNINIPMQKLDLLIGRQTVAFGSARSVNPTDVIAPISIYAIDKEERPGVDALIAKLPLNELSLIETGIVAGKDFLTSTSAYYLRPKFNWEKYDVSFTAMMFKKDKLYGVDIQHPIKEAGFWIESAFIDQNDKKEKDFLRATTGIDYKFKNSLYLCLEYHYNGAVYSINNMIHENYIYLKNKNYSIFTSSYELTPLLIGSLNTYLNLHDQSSFSNLKLDYNFSDNAYIGLGSMLSFGDEIASELGKLGKVYYSSLRYYF